MVAAAGGGSSSTADDLGHHPDEFLADGIDRQYQFCPLRPSRAVSLHLAFIERRQIARELEQLVEKVIASRRQNEVVHRVCFRGTRLRSELLHEGVNDVLSKQLNQD